MIDYTTLATESLLETQKKISKLECEKMVKESNFIMESIMNGYIDTNVKFNEEILIEGAILNSIENFLDRISKFFRERAVKKANKYVEWVKDNEQVFINRVKSRDPFKMRPYWEGKLGGDVTTINAATDKAVLNYKNGTYDDYKWADKMIDSELIEGDSTGDLSDALKNYFRFGIKSKDLPDKEEIAGTQLAGMIPDMVSYVVNYKTNAPNWIDSVAKHTKQKFTDLDKKAEQDGDNKPSNTDDNKSEGNKPTSTTETKPTKDGETGQGESVGINTYLSVEQRPVHESMLTLAMNYSTLMEETDGEKIQKQHEQQSGSKSKEGGKTVKATDIDTTDDKSEQDTGKSEEDKKKEDERKTYLKNIQKYQKYVVSAFSTALEERFVFYIDIFKEIGGSDGKGPKFDKDGRYIKPDNNRKSETNTKESFHEDFPGSTPVAETNKFKSNGIIKSLLG